MGQSPQLNPLSSEVSQFIQDAQSVLLGKDQVIKQALCCLLAGGHLLIEDNPGVGKTTLVKLFAKLLGCQTNRIQFTNDLLPADIIGSSILNPDKTGFVFNHGPIFAQMVIGDELNRATPKTQSACLQAMEEREISIDGDTHKLPSPFFFIATQNPRESIGTFPLPESQLDRFLMKIKIGYPSRDTEKQILEGRAPLEILKDLKPILTPSQVSTIIRSVHKIHSNESVIRYLQDIVERSRSRGVGLSTRAVMGFLRAGKSWAFLDGRDYTIPDDIKAIAEPVMVHRINSDDLSKNPYQQVQEILEQVNPL